MSSREFEITFRKAAISQAALGICVLPVYFMAVLDYCLR